MKQKSQSTTERCQLLVVQYPDYYEEYFSENNIAIRIERVPASHGLDGEKLAEDYLEKVLPPRWRKLYFPGNLKKATNVRPLLPSTIAESRFAQGMIDCLNQLAEKNRSEQKGQMVWIV